MMRRDRPTPRHYKQCPVCGSNSVRVTTKWIYPNPLLRYVKKRVTVYECIAQGCDYYEEIEEEE